MASVDQLVYMFASRSTPFPPSASFIHSSASAVASSSFDFSALAAASSDSRPRASSSSSSHSDESPTLVTTSPSPHEDIPIDSTKSNLKKTSSTRLRSCAPCRLRRVRCDRASGDDGIACLKCTQKGIQCTEMPPRKKKTLVRSGPRLELAKAMYGESAKGKEVMKYLDSEGLSNNALTPIGISSKLLTAELEGRLITALMEHYMTFSAEPLLAGTLISNFEHGGRQLSSLDEQSQVLCLAAIALMARSSDHPLIVGPNAPASRSIANLALQGHDLSEYGRKRSSACDVLMERAIKRADETGTFRKSPTLSSMAALMLLESLVEPHTLGYNRTMVSRPYAAAYTSHARIMLETCSEELATVKAANTLIATAIARDAVRAALTGQSSSFSQDHQLQFRGAGSRLFNGDASCLQPLSFVVTWPRLEDRALSMWIVFDSLFYHVSDMGFAAQSQLSGMNATRAARLDLDFCADFLVRLQLALDATSEVVARGKIYHDHAQDYFRQHQKVLADHETPYIFRHIRALRLARCMNAFLLYRVVHGRLVAHSEAKAALSIFEIDGSVGEDADGYGGRLEILDAQSHLAAFLAARELVDILEEALGEGKCVGDLSWLDSQAQEFYFASLPEWSSILVNMPTEEEGGPTGYDFRSKVATLLTIKQALCAVGWAFPHFSEPLPYIEESLAKVGLAESQFWQALTTSVLDGASTGWTSETTVEGVEATTSESETPFE